MNLVEMHVGVDKAREHQRPRQVDLPLRGGERRPVPGRHAGERPAVDQNAAEYGWLQRVGRRGKGDGQERRGHAGSSEEKHGAGTSTGCASHADRQFPKGKIPKNSRKKTAAIR